MTKPIELFNIVGLRTSRRRSSRAQNGEGGGLEQRNPRSIVVAVMRNSQVLPVSTVKPVKTTEKRGGSCRGIQSFRDAFGTLGIPMLVTLLICIVWTSFLIIVAVAPNQVANLLMGTGEYDNGQFWLITDTNPTMTKAGVVGLAFVNVCYFYVMMKMLCWRKTVTGLVALQQDESQVEASVPSSSLTCSRINTAYLRIKSQYKELTSLRGSNRKYWNVCLKIFNLSMQMTFLLELLSSGNPVALVYTYTGFVAVGSLAGALKILIGKFSAMSEVVAGSVFDLFAAVVYPVCVLVYSCYNFQFDDEIFSTYLTILPPGSFELTARVFADPSEIAFFRLVFDSLRIRSVLDFVLRVGINLSFCYRIMRVGDVLVAVHFRHVALDLAPGLSPTPICQKPVRKVFSIMFIIFSIAVWVFAVQSVESSSSRCSQYPKCVVYAFHWESHDDLCPCRILIDIDTAPKTYEDWIHPVDVYNNVKKLAASGELRSLQLINRQLLELPEELQDCHYLSSIDLIYTNTQSIPPWAKQFKYLETLHLEGKQGNQNLLHLPEDLFSNMPWLTVVHIGAQPNLISFPSLSGVPNLKSLTLAWLFAIREIPSFDHLPNLQRLLLVFLPQLERLPDMEPLQKILDFTLSRPVRACCNGFRGTCDLTDSYCVSNSSLGISTASCLNAEPFLGNVGTREIFSRFSSTVCQKLPSDGIILGGIPTRSMIEICNGKPFGQCQLPGGGIGICYNTRMQVLSCSGDANYINLRRYQIQKSVGLPCDPVIEKWLGCGEVP